MPRRLALVVSIAVLVIAALSLRAMRRHGPHEAHRAKAIETPRLPMRAAPIRWDWVPAGTLRLEGQVIDDAERPVANADVALEGIRTTKSEADGSFVFDKLVAQTVRLEARNDEGVAGPIEARLTATSEPVILRIRRGGTLEVDVRADGNAVEGAHVELRSTLMWNATTDREGRATLRAVGAGWPTLRVEAAGYAPAAIMLRTSGDPARPQKQLVTLVRGGRVSGRVVDANGGAVEGASVIAISTAEPFPVVDPRRDATTTNAAGAFSFPALAAGSWRFVAMHPVHAPGTSVPITIDGEHAMEHVEIRLGREGRLSGVVTDERGRPVNARVRVTRRGAIAMGLERETLADGDGKFSFRGLPTGRVEVAAVGDGASSEILRVDLAESEANVTLVLALRESISGIVVNAAGDVVPEARVFVEPEWSGAIDERDAWAARGIADVVVADGGGAFSFAGLPRGSYRVRASRPGDSDDALWMERGVLVESGARDVRVTVRSEGKVKGRVQYKGGGTPDVFSVEIGATRPQPFSLSDGVFVIDAPGGVRELVVTGATFQRASVPNVEVKEGATIDVGTITVDKGRSVSGRVVDPNGRPVAGAQIAGGLLLTGDGQKLNILSEGFRVQETESDASGRYVLRGFGEHPIVIVAEKQKVGRSSPLRIPRGDSSVELDLVLQPTGGLAGTITKDGRPVADTVVIANPRGAVSSNFFVMTGSDGSYVFDAISTGDWVVAPMLGGGGMRPKDMFYRSVKVEAGSVARADVAVTSGEAKVSVRVVDDKGANVPVAQLMVVASRVDAPNAETLSQAAWLPDDGEIVPLYFRFVMNAPAIVDGMKPGTYSFCATPFHVDPNDQAAMRSLRESGNTMPMYCRVTEIGDGAQAVTIAPKK